MAAAFHGRRTSASGYSPGPGTGQGGVRSALACTGAGARYARSGPAHPASLSPVSPTQPFPFHFRCQRSGNCCARPEGTVRVGPDDVTRIAAHLGSSEAAVYSRFVATSGDRLAEGLGGRCVFLEDGRHAACGIYPVRPERCRTWPYWEEHRKPAELAEAARLCPGITLSGETDDARAADDPDATSR